jgi:G3E family GTPase
MAQGADDKIVTNLLTGFLGSGKTSLLRRLLQDPDLSDTAVLINEFGEVGLDHLLLEKVDDDIVLLESGCICCTIRADLKDAMVRLHGRAQRGTIPAFSRLVIETTGLADPAPIVATVNADTVLRHHFRIGNVVAVVDAVSGPDNLANHAEAAKQVAVADRIVISKIDMVSKARVKQLRRQLTGLNPTAEIAESSEDSRVTAALLSHDVHSDRTRAGEVDRWLRIDRPHAHADHERHSRLLHHQRYAARLGGVRAVAVDAAQPSRDEGAAGEGAAQCRGNAAAGRRSRGSAHHPQAGSPGGMARRRRAQPDRVHRRWPRSGPRHALFSRLLRPGFRSGQ